MYTQEGHVLISDWQSTENDGSFTDIREAQLHIHHYSSLYFHTVTHYFHNFKMVATEDLPGGPVVKNLPCNAGDMG